MAFCLAGRHARFCKRALPIAIVFVFSVLLLLFLDHSLVGARSPQIGHAGDSPQPQIQRCGSANYTNPVADIWRAAEAKYTDLLEDKFTIAISTCHRPGELARTLDALLAPKIPSLLEIVIVWNNFDEQPPKAFTSAHGVAVRYRTPSRDSLNEKLRPDPGYRTKAILLSDDDVYYRPSDLEYAFQMWRHFGQTRLTGALARCASVDQHGQWKYHFCSQRENDGAYAMILTNLAFAHISLLEAYFSDDPSIAKMRQYVDDEFNCEDIALNFVASLVSRSGPLLVRGSDQYVNLQPSQGISRKPGHLEARSKCLNFFADALGCMPLVDETGRIERGYKHNVWYKSAWDYLVV